MEEAKIQWHAAFVSAMDLELAQNRSRDSGQNDAEIKNAIIKVYNVSATEADSYL